MDVEEFRTKPPWEAYEATLLIKGFVPCFEPGGTDVLPITCCRCGDVPAYIRLTDGTTTLGFLACQPFLQFPRLGRAVSGTALFCPIACRTIVVRLRVFSAIDLLRSTSSARLIPSGVSSNAHARINAIGKPITSKSTTRRTAQFGISKKGKIWLATCISNQATTA